METVIFKNGNSQAVRIPKEFRLKGRVADISRCGGRIIIKEKEEISWKEVLAMPCDPDFIFERPDNIPPQERNLF